MGKSNYHARGGGGRSDSGGNRSDDDFKIRKFSYGTSSDAANFVATVEALGRWLALQPWKGAAVASQAIADLTEPSFSFPTRPSRKISVEKTDADGNVTTVDEEIEEYEFKHWYDVFRKKWDRVEESQSQWTDNKTRVFAAIEIRCPDQLLEIVKGLTSYQATYVDRDVIAFLAMIRGVSHNQIETTQSTMSYVRGYVEMMSFGQEANWSSNKYYKLFTAQIETVEAHGGKPWHHPALIKEWVTTLETKYAEEDGSASQFVEKAKKNAPEQAKKEFLACLFLLMSDDDRYKSLKDRLHNNFVLGRDEYPKDIPQATRMLKNFNHEGPKALKKKHPKNAPTKPGLACVQPHGGRNSCAICGSDEHQAGQCDVVTGK